MPCFDEKHDVNQLLTADMEEIVNIIVLAWLPTGLDVETAEDDVDVKRHLVTINMNGQLRRLRSIASRISRPALSRATSDDDISDAVTSRTQARRQPFRAIRTTPTIFIHSVCCFIVDTTTYSAQPADNSKSERKDTVSNISRGRGRTVQRQQLQAPVSLRDRGYSTGTGIPADWVRIG